MINRLLSRIASAIALLAITNMASAQLKIGGDPSTVNNAALLELESTSKGVLLPRLSKVQMDSIANPTAALLIWCTDCTPKGLRVYDGSAWSSFSTSTAPISVMSSVNCSSGTLTGNYMTDVPMNGSNTKILSITGSPGSYDITTQTLNGVRFFKSGTKTVSGGENVTLQATGMPLANGTFIYDVNANGAICQFVVAYRDALYDCGGATATVPTANLITGNSYTGTVTIPYTNGNGHPYNVANTVSSEGLTFTLAPGTYSPAGGTLTYSLSGTYTGTTANPLFEFSATTGCGPAYYIGGARYYQPPAIIGFLINGTYKVGVATTPASNYLDIFTYLSEPGYSSLSTPTINGVSFSTNDYVSSTGTSWTYLRATGTPLAAGTFTYTATDNRGQTMNFNVTFTP